MHFPIIICHFGESCWLHLGIIFEHISSIVGVIFRDRFERTMEARIAELAVGGIGVPGEALKMLSPVI